MAELLGIMIRDWKHSRERTEQWLDDVENMEPLTVMRSGRIRKQRQPRSPSDSMSLISYSNSGKHLTRL